ncbi:MAG: hypothetical protein EOO04_22200 [Chitinophagaceae bacterium]|nr:MAG: hypothetical protein EOO04_22200 [Chitinophagaceae bacterium]
MDNTEIFLYFSILGIIVLLIGLLFIFYKGSCWVQQKFIKEHTGRIQAEVLSTERERQRVAADLHDETGGIIYDLIRKTELIQGKDAASTLLLNGIKARLKELDESVQEVTEGLMPLHLKRDGINTAIRNLVTHYQGVNGINIRLYEIALPKLKAESILHVYRIVQETINNAIRHSQASALIIMQRMEYGDIVISVADNGVGFNPEKAVVSNRKFGLETIRNRLLILGGRLRLNSHRCCEWIFYIPIKANID